jgi:hypothetical protein
MAAASSSSGSANSSISSINYYELKNQMESDGKQRISDLGLLEFLYFGVYLPHMHI